MKLTYLKEHSTRLVGHIFINFLSDIPITISQRTKVKYFVQQKLRPHIHCIERLMAYLNPHIHETEAPTTTRKTM